ncbi:alpha/beta fold hydrolase [Bacillus sp. FJAT-27251]|uniref:alpha/beta fold hydrolase n=1 Tax=Bacillus sp. FJAT-27251 TaxID=1684142 RepID=UPI0006A76782|nr:alpha/beta fold hydrolase [Bacillus sp. FJAT-27251]
MSNQSKGDLADKQHSLTEDFSSGATPRQAVWKKNKAVLWHYPAPCRKYKTPLFLVYSLINQPFILDLYPGSSMIEAFSKEGYEVYLLDFGILGYEDKDLTLDDYILGYIQKGVRRALAHSRSEGITVVGYCLGGTLAAIYAALAKEPLRNLILFSPPLDFENSPVFHQWHKAVKSGALNIDELADLYGTIPPNVMETTFRIITSPISYTPYLSLIGRTGDQRFLEKWYRVNQWIKGHVPFSGAALKQVTNNLLKENQLINNQMVIKDEKVILGNIKASLLVVSASEDELVPEDMIVPVLKKVSSEDLTYKAIKAGHITLAIRGKLPEFLQQWLHERSDFIH